MSALIETIPVPYPARAVARGGRVERDVVLLADVPIRILRDDPPVALDLAPPGILPEPFTRDLGNLPGWWGAPWRYSFHPETGELLSDWRSVFEEKGWFAQGGTLHGMATVHTMRTATGVAELLRSLAKRDARALDPDRNPFVPASVGPALRARAAIMPESTPFRSLVVEDGARDEAITHALAAARRCVVTSSGRLLAPVDPPRWASGYGWAMPWPGGMRLGHATPMPVRLDGRVCPASIPLTRPDIALALNRFTVPVERYGDGTPEAVALEDEDAALGELVGGAVEKLAFSAGCAPLSLLDAWGEADPAALGPVRAAQERVLQAVERLQDRIPPFRAEETVRAGMDVLLAVRERAATLSDRGVRDGILATARSLVEAGTVDRSLHSTAYRMVHVDPREAMTELLDLVRIVRPSLDLPHGLEAVEARLYGDTLPLGAEASR